MRTQRIKILITAAIAFLGLLTIVCKEQNSELHERNINCYN